MQATNKPKQPYKTFPLQPYRNGQWGKKIRGVRRYFGVWAAPQAALEKYNAEKADWEAGRDPRVAPPPPVGTPRLLELADRWLVMRKELIVCPDPDERISRTTWKGSEAAMGLLVDI